MQYIKTILTDTFAMGFDIIMPISGIFLVAVLALALFLIRYISFRHNQKKYERRQEVTTSDLNNEIITILQDTPVVDDIKMQSKEE